MSLLRVLAAGNTTMKDIASKMMMDTRAVSTYLTNLQLLYLVRRDVSLNEPAPEKSRKIRYTIQDPFLNFWFRFVKPNITALETHRGKQLFEHIIQPQFNTYERAAKSGMPLQNAHYVLFSQAGFTRRVRPFLTLITPGALLNLDE